MNKSGIVGYVVEYKMGEPCYLTVPEFHIASRVEVVHAPAWGLYTEPQRDGFPNPEVYSMAGMPLYRGPLLPLNRRTIEETVLRPYPVLVQNHLLLYLPALCPACQGEPETYCQTCGHGSNP